MIDVFDDEKSVVQQLLDEVGKLSENYRMIFDKTEELKALQGVERCMELCLKICGIDGKQPPELVPSQKTSFPLADLPDDLLKEISNHINKLKMQL